MTHKEFCEVGNGSKCVIISTGEPGTVLAVNRDEGQIRLEARRVGLGLVRSWYNYTELGKL